MGKTAVPRPEYGSGIALVIVAALASAVTFGGASAENNEGERVVLENPHVAVHIDANDGAVLGIRDKDLGVTYRMSGLGFSLDTDRGVVEKLHAESVERMDDISTWVFETDAFRVRLHYRLGPADRFVEKWLEVEPKDDQGYFLKEVTLEDAELGEPFREVHFHDDNTIWQCPINLFLRAERGGCFAGLAYPYWQLKLHGSEGFRLGFVPNFPVAAGGSFVSEKYFLGVFRKEGIRRYSQGPYPGRVPSPYISFDKTGLGQHFKSGQVPEAAVEPEVLDWGEVWAMQAYMRHVLPDDLPLPEEGFWVWQNGWWAGLFEPKTEILDQLKQAGVHDIMTAHTWYGRGNHPVAEPYLSQMRIDPMGFPKDAGVAGMPGPAGPAAGLHAEHEEVALDRFAPGEYTPEFVAPPAMQTFWEYGRGVGVHVSSFSLPGLYFEERPEWASVDKNGHVSEYLFNRKVSCPACDAYMEHMLKLLDHVFTKYQPRWWGFDGRWLSYWEVPSYRPGPDGLGFDPCYAEDHGHRPGDNLYREWRNIQNLVQELRRRHPRVCLEEYLGLKRGGPWALRYFNADDNYYETNGAVMNRFQTWHNQNDRFRPPYKNYAAIFGDDAETFQANVLTSISVTSYCQLGPGFRGLALEENRAFLRKWRAWASEHYDYLKVKRDLFGCPGFQRVDGSAHILGDRGFMFLFPLGTAPETIRALIPVNRWLGLNEDTSAAYEFTELCPQEGRSLGICRYGDEFAYDMPAESPVVLSVRPAAPGARPSQPPPRPATDGVVLVKAFTDTAPYPSGAAGGSGGP